MSGDPQEGAPASDIYRPRFEAIFDAHHVDLLAFALRRIGDRAAAEDVVAETFAVAWRRRDVIPDPALPWLYGVARRVLANQRRSDRRGARLQARLRTEPDQALAGCDPAQLVDRRQAVIAAFSRLSEPDQELLRLLAWEQVDQRAAAEILECSRTALRVRLHRARRELRRQLEAESASSGSNPIAAAPEEAR
jgi:RNA polymerase sigma factor (sigma-70 family)